MPKIIKTFSHIIAYPPGNLQPILSPMEIIFNKANKLYLELYHKIYYTIKSARTKKTIWIFEVILAHPLYYAMFKV